MEWTVACVAYLAIGIAVLVWYIRVNPSIDAYEKKQRLKTLVLIPEVCLFWPIALFMGIKARRIGRQADSDQTRH